MTEASIADGAPIQPIAERSISGIPGSEQRIYRFDNQYGASVVRHQFSYGVDEGLWELAVIRWDHGEWHLNYDTPVTGDVIGHLNEIEIQGLLRQIRDLPAAVSA